MPINTPDSVPVRLDLGLDISEAPGSLFRVLGPQGAVDDFRTADKGCSTRRP